MEIRPRGQIIIEPPVVYPIRPKHIDASQHLFGAFDNMETEISARYLIRMAQRSGRWEPFELEQIEAFYEESGHRGFTFNRLVEPGVVRDLGRAPRFEGGGFIVVQNGRYHFTSEFINRSHNSSPKL